MVAARTPPWAVAVSSQMGFHVPIGGKVCSNAVGETFTTAPGSGVGHVCSMIVCMTAQISKIEQTAV
jgi:hypothetical protein